MKLSKRLSVLASYVEKGDIVADIGCDHAQLCCYLILENIVEKAYACDIAEGPLLQAKKSIESYHLENSIDTVLSDGLKNVSDDVTCIVIAGMGFETVAHILNDGLSKIQGKRVIVQVNRDVEGLRKWISDHNYRIIKEKTVLDEHYYQIIVFDCEYDDCLNEEEILFGKRMEKDIEFYSNWKFKLSKYEKILRQMDSTNPRYNEILHNMKQIYNLFGSF